MACTTKAICGSKSSPACCRPCSRIGHLYHQFVICPVDRHGPSQICAAGIQHRCVHDGQRKRVAHMPTATATTEDSRSKLIQNHPHDFTKSEKFFACSTLVASSTTDPEKPRSVEIPTPEIPRLRKASTPDSTTVLARVRFFLREAALGIRFQFDRPSVNRLPNLTPDLECALNGGQIAGWELTRAAGLSEDGSHGQTPHPQRRV